MTKGQEYYKRQILDNSPVTLFTATNTAMFQYPYVLGRPDEKSPTLSSQADVYIMDSGVGERSFDNEDVLDAALDVGADVVIPKDVLHNTRETTEAVMDMAVRVEEHDIDMWIPIQSDTRMGRTEHYDEIRAELSSIGKDICDYRIAVGGIRDSSVEEQILVCKELDDHTEETQKIHAFGCGFHREWVAAIRNSPNMIDSLDTSSVCMYVNNGDTVDSRMEPIEYKLPRGKNSTVLNVMVREQILYMFSHLVGTDVRESDTITEFESDILFELFDC